MGDFVWETKDEDVRPETRAWASHAALLQAETLY